MSSTNLINYFKELPSTAIVAFVKQQKEMSERMKVVYQVRFNFVCRNSIIYANLINFTAY